MQVLPDIAVCRQGVVGVVVMVVVGMAVERKKNSMRTTNHFFNFGSV